MFLEKPEGRKKREEDTARPTEALIFADTDQIVPSADTCLVAQQLKIHLPTQETRVRSLGHGDPLEKEMAIHFSILARKSHGQRSLECYNPWGQKRVGYDLATKQQQILST